MSQSTEFIKSLRLPSWFIDFHTNHVINKDFKFKLLNIKFSFFKFNSAQALENWSHLVAELNENQKNFEIFRQYSFLPFAKSDKYPNSYLCFLEKKEPVIGPHLSTSDRIYLVTENYHSKNSCIYIADSLDSIFDINSIQNEAIADNFLVVQEADKSLLDMSKLTLEHPDRKMDPREKSCKISDAKKRSSKISIDYHIEMIRYTNNDIDEKIEKMIIDIKIQTKSHLIYGYYPFKLSDDGIKLIEGYFQDGHLGSHCWYANEYHNRPKHPRQYFLRYILLTQVLADIISEFEKLYEFENSELFTIFKETKIRQLINKNYTQVDFLMP